MENQQEPVDRGQSEIYESWLRAKRWEPLHRWLGRSGRQDLRLGLLCFLSPVLLPLDEALWGIRGPVSEWTLSLPGPGVISGALLLLLCGANAVAFDRIAALRAGGPRSWWRRGLGWLAGALPLAWLWREAWRARVSEPAVHGAFPPPGASPPAGMASTRLFVLAAFGGCAALLLAACWLAQAALAHGDRPLWLLLPALGLHGATAAVAAAFARHEAAHNNLPARHRPLVQAAWLSWLLPVPYLWLPGALALVAIPGGMTTPLARESLFQRHQAARLETWQHLENRLAITWAERPWWRRWRRPPSPLGRVTESSWTQSRLLRFYDLKTLAVLPEAAVLGWALARLADSPGEGLSAPGRTAWIAAGAAGTLALVGFALTLVHGLLVFTRTVGRLRWLDRHPLARAGARGQLALAVGLAFGAALPGQNPQQMALLGMYGAVLFILLRCLGGFLLARLLPQTAASRQRLAEHVPDFAAGFGLTLFCGLSLFTPLLNPFLLAWAVAAPLTGWAFARWSLPALLRPFHTCHLWDAALPAGLRRRLAVLTLAAVLPLGGLLLPLAIALRARLSAKAAALGSDILVAVRSASA